MKKFLPASKNGFTLIELLVVIAIIAVLAVMGFAAFGGLTGKGNDDRRSADIKAFADAMEVVRAKNNNNNYSATAITANDFGSGTFPSEPTSRAEKYCYKDSTTGAVGNMNVVATACDTANGWANVSGVAPTITANATYFKFCTVNEARTAVICQGSKQ